MRLVKSRSPLRYSRRATFTGTSNGITAGGIIPMTRNMMAATLSSSSVPVKAQKKRHFFVQVEDDKTILLPPNHSVYKQEHLWYFKRSVVHANTETIELKKDCTMSPLLWLNCKCNASGANGWWKGKYDTACDDNSQEVDDIPEVN